MFKIKLLVIEGQCMKCKREYVEEIGQKDISGRLSFSEGYYYEKIMEIDTVCPFCGKKQTRELERY